MLTEIEKIEAETIGLADRFSDSTVDDLGWKLVRMWKGYKDAQPEDFDPLVRLVADKFNRPFPDLENAVDFAWEFAQTADDGGVISNALDRAIEKPIKLDWKVRDRFRMAASIIYYISVEKHGEPFHIPAEWLADKLGLSDENKGDGVRKIIRRLIKHDLIKCVDATYIPRVKSKLYIWTGSASCENGDGIDF